MISWLPMGFEEALHITLDTIAPLGTENIDLSEATGRILAQTLISTIDSPSIDASLKDGYAVLSQDLAAVSGETPVHLTVTGDVAAAGGDKVGELISGTAMRILTGAEIPRGADAVLAEEFAEIRGTTLVAGNSAGPGRNIMPRGTDVKKGQTIARKGDRIIPGLAGIIAASGFSGISVFKQPRVAIIATGDEVVAPGRPLPRGKLYASNMVTLNAFCRQWGMETVLLIAGDDPREIRNVLEKAMADADAVITSGGAWTGDRDLVAKILLELGWKKSFHRIRMGPGKAVGFGMLDQMPVFILPGGPPSNLMGFLQIAFPGIRALAGYKHPCLPTMRAALTSDLQGRDREWTQFVFGTINLQGDTPQFHSLGQKGRLQSMARATAIAAIPEGVTDVSQGAMVDVQILSF
ncbi:molybdopterin molybdochelatase [Desulfocicer vacuolatum DSM 3385]|uniref:Molybdopterin molybdenumtransferase n=1 Tax=Desulfocicer vacuolatum DSM 3385 TaxID=1121400 RepID=A0A1W1ZW86_9BACT|nr:gephyrin-like molybdotransferase Glp [Desulfocicer vacuolatum]SMC52667.1 molybdopterin molybdochelatase [Desulfocicer vacuolatum DSM 3385]